MNPAPDLEARTVMKFHDGEDEISRSYRGLLPLKQGDIIDLVRNGEMPVRAGSYIVTQDAIPHQMGIDFDDKQPDSIIRYFDLIYKGS